MARRSRDAAAMVGTFASVLASGCLGLGREEMKEHVRADGPVVRVEIDLDGGTIDLRGSAGPDASGTIRSRWSESAPEIVHYVEDGVLRILGRCDPYAGPCLLDVNISVPASAAVGIVTGGGDVRVRGFTGDVEVMTGDGAVEAHDIGGSLFVENDTGSIRGDALSGAYVDARTGEGDVELRMDARPVRLVGRTGDGDVVLVVPAGDYRVETDAPRGELAVGASVRDDPAAEGVLSGASARGDVSIRSTERPNTRR